ncbi:hypothetical protein [Lacrimispora sp.]|uniref:hypothetical protein n=1 Tax=Lacrimispora sp. TaxID=2719234 RepID=UPI0028A826E2|nr:hypothetical protein [Lacrimispora sp.]
MKEFLYSSFDLACIINSMNLGAQETGRLLEELFYKDRFFLEGNYRNDKRRLYLDVHYWLDYLSDKPTIDAEFPSIQKDFDLFGKKIAEDSFITEYFDLDLFFKKMRLQLLFLGNQDFIRMKLRTMLRAYGYKRRSEKLLRYLKDSLLFYHIETYVRGGAGCNISEIGLDEMITFRICG